MFKRVFQGDRFSYFHNKETEQYMLYWSKYDISIVLKDNDASIFRQQIELIESEPEKDIKARIEKAIKIHFYFKYACPIPHFTDV
jgi:hypothetical protein